MFESATNENKVVSEELVVTYETTIVRGSEGLPAYRHKRVATKRYAYIAMTESAALAAARLKNAKYTREYYAVLETDEGLLQLHFPTMMSEIVVEHDEGPAYRLSIAVNEIDEKVSDNASAVETFAAENQRDYDDADGAAFGITSAVRFTNSSTLVMFNNGQSRRFDVQYKTSATALRWENLEVYDRIGMFSGVKTVSLNAGDIQVGRLVRLISGNETSDPVVVERG